MKKTAVIYWSGTGNTEAMANAVLEGMKAAGAEATLLTPDQVDASALSDYAAIAFGCPAMGSEVLEESEFEPMFDGCKNSIGGKRVALFGSYGWATASGCAPGRSPATTRTSTSSPRASSAARLPMTTRWPPAPRWARRWPSNSSPLHIEKPLW